MSKINCESREEVTGKLSWIWGYQRKLTPLLPTADGGGSGEGLFLELILVVGRKRKSRGYAEH